MLVLISACLITLLYRSDGRLPDGLRQCSIGEHENEDLLRAGCEAEDGDHVAIAIGTSNKALNNGTAACQFMRAATTTLPARTSLREPQSCVSPS